MENGQSCDIIIGLGFNKDGNQIPDSSISLFKFNDKTLYLTFKDGDNSNLHTIQCNRDTLLTLVNTIKELVSNI